MLPGQCYTYKTLQHLKEQFPEDQFFFIMGADSLDYFDKWRHPEIICQNATVLAAVRDTLELPQIEEKIRRIKALFPAEIYPLAGGRTDVSSTAIRAQIRMTGECPAMLPGEVWELDQTLSSVRCIESGRIKMEQHEIRKRLKKELDKGRYEHTKGVMYTAGCMAMCL